MSRPDICPVVPPSSTGCCETHPETGDNVPSWAPWAGTGAAAAAAHSAALLFARRRRVRRAYSNNEYTIGRKDIKWLRFPAEPLRGDDCVRDNAASLPAEDAD